MIHFRCDKYAHVSLFLSLYIFSSDMGNEFMYARFRGQKTNDASQWQHNEALNIMNSFPVYLLNWSSLNRKTLFLCFPP